MKIGLEKPKKALSEAEKRLRRLNIGMGLALFAIAALTAVVFFVGASEVTNRQDKLSNQKINSTSLHTISFNLSGGNTFAAGEQLAIRLSSQFTLGGIWDPTDFTLNDGTIRTIAGVNAGAGVVTVACADGINNVGVAVNTTDNSFRVIPCGPSFTASGAGVFITFTIDGATPNGTVTNPVTAGSYELKVLDGAGDCLAPTDNCTLGVAIADDTQVGISAVVPGGSGGGGGGGTPDIIPPVISLITVTNITTTSALVGWMTNEAADSLVRFGLTTSYGNTAVDSGFVLTHSVPLTGLSEGTLYHFQVCSKDPANNLACSSDQTFSTPDLTPPVISGVAVTNITANGATISWSTNEPATSLVDYGTVAGPPYAQGAGDSGSYVLTHSVVLTGLTPGTTYHYRVRSGDASANEAFTADATFATLAPPHTTPPVISAVTVTAITANSATVTWTTDEPATSYVDFGPNTSYGTTLGSSSLVTSHSVVISPLTEATLYHFRVRSADASSNEASSADGTFTTLDVTPPVISAVTATNITTTTARITWTTNEPADSLVNYGKTTGYGASQTNASMVTSHQIDLSGLDPDTTYHYQVKSKDPSNNLATSADFTFKTLKPAPPVITNIQVTNITQTTARITWTTDTLSNSAADYGKTITYGSTQTNPTMVTSHLVPLSGLTKGTTYHFQVRSSDVLAQETVSADGTFSTLADITPPANVTNLTATAGDGIVNLSWTNPTDPDFAGVKLMRKTTGFPANPSDGTLAYDGTAQTFPDTGRTNGVTYYYGAFTYDDVPNYSSGAVASATPAGPPDTTPPGNVSNFTATAGNAQITLTWTNPTDPDFAGVKIVRKALSCPTSPTDGTLVFDGVDTTKLDLSVANGTLYCYAAFTYDGVPNVSSGVTVSATPVAPPDTTPPTPVTNFTAVAGDAIVQLTWQNPTDTDWAGTRIVRKTGSAPTSPTDGTIVFEGVGDNRMDINLANGTTYYYAAFAFDTSFNFASPAQTQATPTASAPPPPPPSCTDTDGGRSYDNQGQVTDNSGVFIDSCVDRSTLTEYYCDAGVGKSETHACGDGFKCSGGRCVVETMQPSATVCGNGICEGAENSLNCVQDCPVAPVAPPVVPAAPEVSAPQRISLNELHFFATAGQLRLVVGGDNRLSVYPSMTVRVVVPDAAIRKPIKSAYVNFLGSAYIMRQTHSYEAVITTPSALGEKPLDVVVNYEDNTSDTIPAKLNVVPFGQVYEVRDDGSEAGITGARVSLYVDTGGGNYGLFNAAALGQQNPQVTGENGTYSFIVPPGTYKLVAELDGYRTKETLGFPITTENVITTRLALIKLPPPPVKKIADAIAAPTPVAEKAAVVASVVAEQTEYAARATVDQVQEVISNPIVERQVETTAAPVAATVAVVNVASVGAATASGIPYLMYLFSFVAHPALLFGRRKRKKWGVVYNSLTKRPVDLAIVRLLDGKTDRVMRSAVTDKDGRYFFIVQPGEYKLSVSRAGYIFPSTFLKNEKEDGVWVDLYHGEVIKAGESTAITANIPVDPVEAKAKSSRHITWAGIGRRLQKSIAILSILAMVVAVIIKPSILMIVLLAVNVATYVVFRRLSVAARPKNWGIVYDESTGKPIRNALARIFEAKFNKLLETQITDNRGRYSFLVGRNVYYVTFEKPGYQKQQKGPVNLLEHKEAEGVIAVDVTLKPEAGAGKKPAAGKPGASAAPAAPTGAAPAPSVPPAAPAAPVAPTTPAPSAPAPAAEPAKPAAKIPWELEMLRKGALKATPAPAAAPPAPAQATAPAPAVPPAPPQPAAAPAAEPAKPAAKIPWELELLRKGALKATPAAQPPAPSAPPVSPPAPAQPAPAPAPTPAAQPAAAPAEQTLAAPPPIPIAPLPPLTPPAPSAPVAPAAPVAPPPVAAAPAVAGSLAEQPKPQEKPVVEPKNEGTKTVMGAMSIPRTKLIQDVQHAHPETGLIQDTGGAHPEEKRDVGPPGSPPAPPAPGTPGGGQPGAPGSGP